MKIVGLTGGIACGKSSVSKFLKERNIPIVDADLIAHRIILPGTTTYNKVVSAFGQNHIIFQESKSENGMRLIDRKKLGSIVFTDETARRKLNSIMSGAIAFEMFKEIIYYFLIGTSVLVLDVPLLFETGMDKICHEIIVVYITPEVQLKRLMDRDKSGETDAKSRISSQKLSPESKAKRAQYVLDNSKGLADLSESVERIYPKILQRGFRSLIFSLPTLVATLIIPIACLIALHINQRN